jgi:hypothetical protein
MCAFREQMMQLKFQIQSMQWLKLALDYLDCGCILRKRVNHEKIMSIQTKPIINSAD